MTWLNRLGAAMFLVPCGTAFVYFFVVNWPVTLVILYFLAAAVCMGWKG